MPKAAEPCFYCGEQTARTLTPSDCSRTRDHVVPLALGGTNEYENLVVACGWCNSSKRDMFHHEWVTWLACIDIYKRGSTFRRKSTAVLNRWWFMVPEMLDREQA